MSYIIIHTSFLDMKYLSLLNCLSPKIVLSVCLYTANGFYKANIFSTEHKLFKYDPRREKTSPRGVRLGKTKICMLNLRTYSEA